MNDYQEKMKLKYQSVNNLWKDVKVPYITRVEAEKAVKKLMIKFGKPKFAPPNIRYGMLRYCSVENVWYKTFVCLSGDPTTQWKGWRDLIHLVSHKVYRYRCGFKRRLKPHSYQQAEIEFDMSQFIISSGWLDGGLKPKVVVLTKEQKRQKKLDHYQKLISRWQTKMKLANTFVRKYNKKVKYLNKQ